jgi:hypothetical protein
MEQVDYQFCVVKDCDANFGKLRELCKGQSRPPKRKTFVDCQRKLPGEM